MVVKRTHVGILTLVFVSLLLSAHNTMYHYVAFCCVLQSVLEMVSVTSWFSYSVVQWQWKCLCRLFFLTHSHLFFIFLPVSVLYLFCKSDFFEFYNICLIQEHSVQKRTLNLGLKSDLEKKNLRTVHCHL